MVDFAESITDGRLRELVIVALNGRGAFRPFKDVLLGEPDQRVPWFAFAGEQRRVRAGKG